MKIYRDKDGKCINIGEWDHQVSDTADGQVVTNPLPYGAYEDEADVVTGPDGGLYIADNPHLT